MAMDPTGDITDELADDDDLRRSLETAADGQWAANQAQFVDPKYEAIRKQLAEVPRTNYNERRLIDLQRRAEANATTDAAAQAAAEAAAARAALAAAAATAAKAATTDWRDALVPSHREAAPANHAVDGPLAELPRLEAFEPRAHDEPELPAELRQRIPRTAVVDYALSVLSAVCVFGPVGLVHGGIMGWTLRVLWNSIGASLIAGFAWSFLDAGRFRAGMTGLAAYLIAFTTGGGDVDGALMATFFGSLIALLGSGIVGLVREESPVRRTR